MREHCRGIREACCEGICERSSSGPKKMLSEAQKSCASGGKDKGPQRNEVEFAEDEIGASVIGNRCSN
jgi:hypothetical protein